MPDDDARAIAARLTKIAVPRGWACVTKRGRWLQFGVTKDEAARGYEHLITEGQCKLVRVRAALAEMEAQHDH